MELPQAQTLFLRDTPWPASHCTGMWHATVMCQNFIRDMSVCMEYCAAWLAKCTKNELWKCKGVYRFIKACACWECRACNNVPKSSCNVPVVKLPCMPPWWCCTGLLLLVQWPLHDVKLYATLLKGAVYANTVSKVNCNTQTTTKSECKNWHSHTVQTQNSEPEVLPGCTIFRVITLSQNLQKVRLSRVLGLQKKHQARRWHSHFKKTWLHENIEH